MDRSRHIQKYKDAPNADRLDYCIDKFKEADTNNDGAIGENEYVKFLQNMFPGGPSKAEAVADYRKSHTKTPGKVTLDEWLDDLMYQE